MYLLELAFDGSPDRLAVRPAHRERLRVLHEAGRVVMAGPYSDETGALLLFDVTAKEFDAIIDDDPYYRAPGVTIVRRQEWVPLFR
ncbi:YciI family protein [Dactylosporangium sp. NPDC050588]|uniref:YciI family protein n=1 Tax=Dactylosporangium sp. NPDC050588 TaxID=3157211 RepID=UPI0033D9241F